MGIPAVHERRIILKQADGWYDVLKVTPTGSHIPIRTGLDLYTAKQLAGEGADPGRVFDDAPSDTDSLPGQPT